MTADHSVFENNHAGTGGLGGAIAAGKLSVDSASFIDNGRYGSGEGGAIFVAGLSGADTVTDSSFVGNKAQTGGAIGASVPSLTLTNTDFASNEASQGGGAVAMSPLTAAAGDLVLEAGHYFKNRAGGFGGAVLGSGNSTDVYRASFHGNVAQSGGAIAQTTGKLIMLDGTSTATLRIGWAAAGSGSARGPRQP